MPRDMASLLSKPMAPALPAGSDAASGGDQAGGSLQGLVGQGQAAQPMSYQEVVSTLQHLTAFQREWRKLLSLPDAGKKDIKGPIMEMMADMMGEGYVTLAQTMDQLKNLPATPLGQKQWLEEHNRKTQQAAIAVMAHFDQTNPVPGPEQFAAASQMPGRDKSGHAGVMTAIAKRYGGGK